MKPLSPTLEPVAPADSQFLRLIRAAAGWRLLGLLFARPRGDWQTQVNSLAGEVDDADLREAADAALQEATEGIYDSAFGPGGPAAPREISHRQSALSGQYLAEVLGYYESFGYRPPYDEPPDHVAVEVDFLAYLRLKQAYAIARGDDEQTAVTADAARQFCQEHLSMIAAPLAKSLEASGIRYLSLAAAALHRRAGKLSEPLQTPASPWDAITGPQLPIHCPENCCGEYHDT